jgi:hypothetical protein
VALLRVDYADALSDEPLAESERRLRPALPRRRMGRGRPIRQSDERNYISDTDLARMFAHIDVEGLPRNQALTITRGLSKRRHRPAGPP